MDDWRARARSALDAKTMPRGALGQLEALAETLADVHGTLAPDLARVRCAIFVADHGVAREGVSAYPREVTAAMLANFAAGGAALNVLARALEVEVEVVDVGVDAGAVPAGVVDARIGAGTSNLLYGPAMSSSQCQLALAAGAAAVARAGGCGALGIGEMGIGNTTAASALLAAVSCHRPEDCVGAGTGVAGAALARKRAVVAQAVARCGALTDPARLLAELGGFEIAAMCGAMIAAAERRIPIVVDGFVATVAALIAVRLAPETRRVLLFAHRSAERAHGLALEALAARPLLDLDLRLGEGSGAVLAMPLLRAAAAILAEMATFESACVPERKP
jgi:nicotinate-nucleotide--dimethylbenzimidazole phosphoribosyltransferase